MRTLTLCALLSCLSFSNAFAIVIVDQNVLLTTPAIIAEYELLVCQDVGDVGCDHTAVYFDVTDTNVIAGTTLGLEVTYRTTLVDEGSFWYLADCGDPLLSETVNSGTYPQVFGDTYLIGQETVIPYGEFILGIATRQDHLDDPDIFGWARMEASPDGITLLGSAMAYDEIGINACSVVAIPEPNSSLLLIGGAALCLLVSRRPIPKSLLV